MNDDVALFLKERTLILQFLAERTSQSPRGFVYLVDLLGAYRGWRRNFLFGPSKLSVTSFARALPESFERKLMNRERKGQNPARAVVGLVLK